jgi:MoaA/NifB/PqqE/SkfB family radical SAM enzyme
LPLRPRLARTVRALLDDHPQAKRLASGVDDAWTRAVHRAAERWPFLIRPEPRQLTIAVTAACNFRCRGCRYGRDFMVGERLSLDVVRVVLDDAVKAGIGRVRFYGGEPLLHPDLAKMIAHGTALGLDCYVTTNGVLLGRRIDELYEAGLRWFTMGYYGVGSDFGEYTDRPDQLDELIHGLGVVRDRYGDRVERQLNYVLTKPTCNTESLERGLEFARRFAMVLHLDLLAFNLPFFNHDPSLGLAFTENDRPAIEDVVHKVIALKESDDALVPHSYEFLRSVPDWLILGAKMAVPCDAYELVWIGADGTVQLCDGAYPLGNVNHQRLRDVLFTPQHVAAARGGFRLECGNCNCKLDSRIRRNADSRRRYKT